MADCHYDEADADEGIERTRPPDEGEPLKWTNHRDAKAGEGDD